MKLIHSIYILLLLPILAQANDGFGELGIGGVVLDKTTDIAMQKEVLDISYKKIHVSYEFINESNHEITTTVSFPLPKYGAAPALSGVLAAGEPANFHVMVNGHSVKFDTSVQAIQDNKDITEQLLSVGFNKQELAAMPFQISKQPIHQPLRGIINTEQKSELTKAGLLMEQYPDWDIQITYHWKQVFPPKSVVRISHEYAPFVAVGTASSYDHQSFSELKYFQQFCVDKASTTKLDHLSKNAEKLYGNNEVRGTIVKYVLLTANSWKDGVRDFTLRIHKESPDEIVSLCFPGKFEKINSKTFVTHITNFTPHDNLSIYFGNIAPYDAFKYYGGIPHFSE